MAAAIVSAPLGAQKFQDFTTPLPLPRDSYLVIGILGGVEPWNSETRPVRKLALDIRAKGLPNVYVETVENRHRGLALKLIKQALDRDGDGRLSAEECSAARIILYGHSLGGAAAVQLARDLKALGVPVLLTIQVDSVGLHDATIPANVRKAANFYQHSSKVIRGRADIHAEDPEKTTILGNFKYSYAHKDVDLSNATVLERAAHNAHTKMEFDPDVWAQVEALILEQIQ